MYLIRQRFHKHNFYDDWCFTLPLQSNAFVFDQIQSSKIPHKLHEQVHLMAVTEALAIPLIVTTLDDASDLYQTALPKHAAWVFGNEGQGVADPLLKRADIRIKIMHDQAVESLNVTVASAVCLFEQRRQHTRH